jgi:hypothetical protein
MNEAEETRGVEQKELRRDPGQLALLKRCSEMKDMTEWHKWCEENPHEVIWLEGADLSGFHLETANLSFTHLKGANIERAHLKRSELNGADLQEAKLAYADLEEAIINARLERASLYGAHLEGANLDGAYLEGADLTRAHLEGASFQRAHLQGARFEASVVNGLTCFWQCSVDRKTDFRGVALDSCRMDEGTKYLLEYNKRRMNWEYWYMGQSWKNRGRITHQLLTFPVRLFWCLSDYGKSTIRILAFFFALAIIFAVVYWAKPDCVMVNGQVGGLVDFLHALYFSVVTMTTLGFGDIAANPQSSCGQVLLMLQVFWGYFLLGAIVTRLSILFTAGGPAGRFSRRSTKEPGRDE